MPETDPGQQLRVADITTDAGTVTARIIGPVIEQNRAAAILDTVKKAIQEAGEALTGLVLDFEDVTFITSSGIGACIELRNGLTERDVKTIIYRPTPEVVDTLTKMRLDALYTIVHTAGDLEIAISSAP